MSQRKMQLTSKRVKRPRNGIKSAAGQIENAALKRSLGSICFDKVHASLLDPSSWSCNTCDTTKSLWVCLTCGKFLCNEPSKKKHKPHLREHVQHKSHFIFMELNASDHQVYCFESKQIVNQDNCKGDIFLLRTVLRHVQDLEGDVRLTRNSASCELVDKHLRSRRRWHALGITSTFTFHLAYFSPNAICRRAQRDKIYTAFCRWRHLLLLKCFNSWRIMRFLALDATNTASVLPSPSPSPTAAASTSHAGLFPGSTGLRNLGNTCYLNAVLQALSHVNEFRDYIMKQQFPPQVELCLEMQGVIKKLWCAKYAAFSPDAFVTTIWKLFPSLAGFKQQDSDELLRFMLERIHVEETEVCSATSPTKANLPGLIKKLFEGNIVHEIQCQRCGTVSQTKESFLGSLSIEIPFTFRTQSRVQRSTSNTPVSFTPSFATSSFRSRSKCDLTSCLEVLVQKERLEGDSQYFCGNCQSKQDAERRTRLYDMPPIVILHINRTDWINGSTKIQTLVVFPEVLDASKYHDGLEPECSTSSSSTVPSEFLYQLRAVIVHDGRSLSQGHYTAYAYNSLRRCWLHFNDHRVKVVSWEDVSSQQAYLLLYARKRHL